MLSRVADSIYWMSRYVERAENVARFVDVNLNLMLDSPTIDQQWQPLVNTTGDHVDFAKRYGAVATPENVLRFLTFDRENPNSIISCLRAARENARSVREIISSEMWLQLNTFYLMVNSAAGSGQGFQSPPGFYSDVKQASHLFTGITDATMTHSEGWHFCRLGRKLERADKTSRILDVKYFIILHSVSDVGTIHDDVQWVAVLRSASAFEMYRKRHGRISPMAIVEFLLLDPEFPRAVRFCLNSARDSLHAISGTPMGANHKDAEKLLGKICSDLGNATVDEIITGGLHEYLDALQTNVNEASTGIYERFFAARVPEPVQMPKPRQTQKQKQQ
jgi:uncharacterized alpha-E superfamily protein